MHSMDSTYMTSEQHAVCIATCKKNLTRFLKEGNTFLDRIVTEDKSWYHYHIPTSKQSSLTWKQKNSQYTMKTSQKHCLEN